MWRHTPKILYMAARILGIITWPDAIVSEKTQVMNDGIRCEIISVILI